MQTQCRLLFWCATLLAPLSGVTAQEPDKTANNAWRSLVQGNGCKVILSRDGQDIELVFRDGKVQSMDSKDPTVQLKKTEGGGAQVTTKDGTVLLRIESAPANPFLAQSLKRAHLGVTMGRVDDSLAAHLDLQPDQVTLVLEVPEGQPADKAGVKKFDIIVAVDGQTPATEEKVREALARKKPGDKLELKVRRRSGEETIQVTLGEMSVFGWGDYRANQLLNTYMLRDQNLAPYLYSSGQLSPLRWADGKNYTLYGYGSQPEQKKQSADEPDSKADLENIKKQLDRLDELLKKLAEQVKDK